MDRRPLKKWIHPSYRVILLGDACHPMLVRLPLSSLHLSQNLIVVPHTSALPRSRRGNGHRRRRRPRQPPLAPLPPLPAARAPPSVRGPPPPAYRRDAKPIPSKPEDLPPPRRAGASRARRGHAARHRGRAAPHPRGPCGGRGCAQREREPVGGCGEEPRPVLVRRG